MKEEFKEIKEEIKSLMDMLESNGLELDENGDIIDAKTKKLVLFKDDDESE